MPYHITKPPTSSLIGTTINGASSVTGLSSTSALYAGQPVSGPGIPSGTSITAIGSSSAVTLSHNVTASGTVSLAFGVEPVTLAEAKQHLQINYSDDDARIGKLITMARQYAEAWLEQSLLTTGWELILDGFPGILSPFSPWFSWERNGSTPVVIELRRPPIQSVGDITCLDAQGSEQTLVSGVDFVVRNLGVPTAPLRIYPVTGRSWPATLREYDTVRIPFTAGYGHTADTVPACIYAGMLMLIEAKYKNRSAETEIANNMGEVPIAVDRLFSIADWGARV